MRLAQQGDGDAFDVVFRLVHPLLVGYVRPMVGAEAEDVIGEVWVEIARTLPRFSGNGSDFRAWAARIARNRAVDHLRRRIAAPPVSELDTEALALAGRADTAEQAIERASTGEVLGLLRELPPERAQAVMLRAVLGLDGPSAARMLGKRPGALRSAVHRGLRQLARRLADDEELGRADGEGGVGLGGGTGQARPSAIGRTGGETSGT
ncbi:hypothetical protein BIV57_05275 [Mangrovactinospora gilvigrisea]|uniref:RNA polymerase subunit sigma-70 n=1 Tax=Mangrovactinospora gilvigrisea TaxID=1428644 RepID=A0A1J7BYJ0_9ACTN|nr:hypothetical protein BIV57_05275 [Mangrovactinospora gilvigrisea]